MDNTLKQLFVPADISIKLKECGFPEDPSLGYCYDPLAVVPDHLFKYSEEASCSTDERMKRLVTAPLYDQVFNWAAAKHNIHVGYYYCTDEEVAKSDIIQTNYMFTVNLSGKRKFKMTIFADDKTAGYNAATLAIIQLITTLL